MIGRFDANSYLVLSEAMNHYDLGRGYGGAREALSRVRAQVTVAGISSDRLYPLRLQWELVRAARMRGRCSGHRLDRRPRRVPRGAPGNGKCDPRGAQLIEAGHGALRAGLGTPVAGRRAVTRL